MKAFAELYAALDETTKTSEKVDALARYFTSVPPADAAWAVHFLSGRRPKRLVGGRKLADWALEFTGTPEWLFGECYEAVGDLAETITLLLPPSRASSDLPLRAWVERLLALRGESDDTQRDAIFRAWGELDGQQAYVWNKLITGSFRVGVSQQLVVRALARVSGVDEAAVAHRLMGAWDHPPSSTTACWAPTRATPTSAARTPSSWRTRWRASPTSWASRPSGRSSGSGTASARRSSAARGRRSSGRAARSW